MKCHDPTHKILKSKHSILSSCQGSATCTVHMCLQQQLTGKKAENLSWSVERR